MKDGGGNLQKQIIPESLNASHIVQPTLLLMYTHTAKHQQVTHTHTHAHSMMMSYFSLEPVMANSWEKPRADNQHVRLNCQTAGSQTSTHRPACILWVMWTV